ncbi:hypothetical protein K488DRAFT_21763, partial [Vararia minispora EC-137]
MPSILNLKFKGNKSFIAFSNLGDVCTKVAGYLEQGQRLENLSWRLWHLQNLMVDTDNARSKREFRKLSKTMGDKLDKEKGRTIEELEAPGFRRNASTEMIRQRAAEKERSREASQNARPGTIKRMQFTFSVDQPAQPPSAQHVDKPDFKPSNEFKDARRRPSTRAAARDATAAHRTDTPAATATATAAAHSADAQDPPPLTQRGRKPQLAIDAATADELAALRFPSLFSTDFGPAALLYPTPTLSNGNTYGEGVRTSAASSDAFSIVRPTIELPLDELLEASPSPAAIIDWPTQDAQTPMDTEPSNFDVRSALARAQADVPPQPTVAPSKLGPPQQQISTTLRPVLNVRTSLSQAQAAVQSAITAPAASSRALSGSNTAPGGAKAECSNCGATHTPLWRRGLNDELNCNACGLYCKLHKRPRPKTMRNTHASETRANAATAARQEPAETIPLAQCYNCHTTATPLWRKDEEGKTVCNAYKLHGSARPISMKSDVIRKRSRHDARRAGNATSETPSASPGASRRASPNSADASIASPPYEPVQNQSQSQSQQQTQTQHDTWHPDGAFAESAFGGLMYPGPYHPDYLAQVFGTGAGAGAGATGEDAGEEDGRAAKRRRLSAASSSAGASGTEPPASAVSYSAFSEGSIQAQAAAAVVATGGVDFPFGAYAAYGVRGFWHPPMLPP